MRLHLILDVSPEDGERPANSEVILAGLENEIEANPLDIDGRVYEVKVLGSGRTANGSIESMNLRKGGRR